MWQYCKTIVSCNAHPQYIHSKIIHGFNVIDYTAIVQICFQHLN